MSVALLQKQQVKETYSLLEANSQDIHIHVGTRKKGWHFDV